MERKGKVVVNRLRGGVSKTIPAGYWHFYTQNILFRTDGFAANGVMEITRIKE